MDFLNFNHWTSPFPQHPKNSKGPFDWVSLPFHNKDFCEMMKNHEPTDLTFFTLFFLSSKVKKSNMMLDVPACNSQLGTNAQTPRFYDEKPIDSKTFKSGNNPLRLRINESPLTEILINARVRTMMLGNSGFFHHGPRWDVNTEKRYFADEVLTWLVNGQTVLHHKCYRPPATLASGGIDNAKIIDAIGKLNNLDSSGFKNSPSSDPEQTKINHQLQSNIGDIFNTKLIRNPSMFALKDIPVEVCKQLSLIIPDLSQDPRDDLRDSKKPRSQVWERVEGVMRIEAVQSDPNNIFVNRGYVARNSATYQGGAMQGANVLTHALSKDSPHVLIEVRPSNVIKGKGLTYDGLKVDGLDTNIRGDDIAKLVMASPQFILVGADNPGTVQSNAESSAYTWAGTKPLANTTGVVSDKLSDERHDDTKQHNIFAVTGNKEVEKCWLNAIPEPAEVEKSMESYFGILGGEKLISHNTIPKKSGMEIFGRDALVLGAGTKKNETWTSYIQLLSQDETNNIELNTKIPNEGDRAASCTLNLSGLSKTGKANANLYSTNTDNKDTGVFISSDGKITFKIEGEEILKLSKDSIIFPNHYFHPEWDNNVKFIRQKPTKGIFGCLTVKTP